MAKGKAARKAPASKSVLALDPDYDAFPDTAKGRAMARQAARKAADEKVEAKGGSDEPFVVAETDETA